MSRLMAGKSEGFALDSKKVILDVVWGLFRPIPFNEVCRSMVNGPVIGVNVVMPMTKVMMLRAFPG